MNNKIYSLALALCLSVISLSSQSVVDLLKYSDNSILGTARYMGMAGSFGALGGDPSAILDNPAALGIYRSSEVSFTLNPTITKTYSLSKTQRVGLDDFHFNFNSASIVVAIPTFREKGVLSANLSFNYNKVKDYSRIVGYKNNGAMPTIASSLARMTNGLESGDIYPENESVPFLSDLAFQGYLIDPNAGGVSHQWSTPFTSNTNSSYYAVESGAVDEYNIAFSMNISHKFYIGMSLGIQSLYYSMRSENFERYNDTEIMKLDNQFSASGVGANFGIGFIYRATPFLRLGASLHTPTYYIMRENYSGEIDSEIFFADTLRHSAYTSGDAYNSYDYSTPLKFMASAAFIIDKRAIINVEYQLTDYNSTMRFSEEYSFGFEDYSGYTYENKEIGKYAKISHTAKIGAEYRIASQYSFRLGFAYVTPAVSENVVRTMLDNTTRTDLEYFYDKGSMYGSVGFGYRYNGFGADIAYMCRYKTEGFATHQTDAEILGNGRFGVPEAASGKNYSMANIETFKHNIALTISYKF